MLRLVAEGYMYPVAAKPHMEMSVWHQLQRQGAVEPWVHRHTYHETCREAAIMCAKEGLVCAIAATGPDSIDTVDAINFILAI